GLGPLDEILGVPYYGNTLYQYVFFVLIFILSVLLARLLLTVVRRYFEKAIAKAGMKMEDYATQILDAPVAYFIVLIGIFIGLQYITLESSLQSAVYNILGLLVGLGVLWIILRTIETYLRYGLVPIQADKKFQMQIIPSLSKFTKVVVFIIAVIIIMGNLGFDVTALITGFGIAGLAVGLAAKDVLSDIFGGISIFSKKLFLVGDNITVLGLTGTVEEVDMRTTRIRTADGKLISIPNAQVAANPVTINSRGKRTTQEEGKEIVPVSMDLNLVYGTSAAKISKAIR
ncbi:MAG: mechanosensitive ion channel, partial [Candidatus Micrarchaeia archaeon]